MAGKQLGKLRQWASEAISSSSKTTVTDEFRELEHDIDLRREGIQRLSLASREFHLSLTRKKENPATGESEKLLPRDAQGVVMIRHGEEFGDDSAYGSSLVRFGRAQCKIATLQEAMGLTFKDTFSRALARYEDEIVDYQAQRKKLESRRLSYDAAMTKLESVKKNKKAKETELEEAEEEVTRSKQRYEEASEDVHTRMYAIQQNEIEQLRDLGAWLELELNFFSQAHEILQEVKEGWTDESHINQPNRPRATGPSHTFARSAEEVNNNREKSGSGTESDEEKRSGSVRRKASRKTSSFSLPGRKGSVRKRSDSIATEKGDGNESSKEKEAKSEKRKSLGGWGMSWGKSSSKKDKFSGMKGELGSDDEAASDDDDVQSRKSSRSTRSTPNRTLTKSPRPTLSRQGSSKREIASLGTKTNKRIVALYDYAARADDELGFTMGQELVLTNIVSDDWWMGSLKGKIGLFPAAYVRMLPADSTPVPALPARPPPAAVTNLMLKDDASASTGENNQYLPSPARYSESEDSDHPFGDHYLVTARSPAQYGFQVGGASLNGDVDSMMSAQSDGESALDEEAPVLGRKPSSNESVGATNGLSRSENSSMRATPIIQAQAAGGRPVLPARTSSAKRTPPPVPPPRRPSSISMSQSSTSVSSLTPGTPPIPSRTQSGSLGNVLRGSIARKTEVVESPFD